MKKVLLVSAIALFGIVSAQEYKPAAGDITVDLGVSGGLGNTSIALADGGTAFKVRYFKEDKLAYRFTMVLANNNKTANPSNTVESKDNDFSLGLGFGAEKHFTGTDRLSPYVGGDILIAYVSQSSKTTSTPTSGTQVISEVTGPNSFGAGVRGVFGADYYFAKRVFLGVEAGLSLLYSSEGDKTTKVTGIPDVTSKGGNNFNISPAIVTGIRIGYAF